MDIYEQMPRNSNSLEFVKTEHLDFARLLAENSISFIGLDNSKAKVAAKLITKPWVKRWLSKNETTKQGRTVAKL